MASSDQDKELEEICEALKLYQEDGHDLSASQFEMITDPRTYVMMKLVKKSEHWHELTKVIEATIWE